MNQQAIKIEMKNTSKTVKINNDTTSLLIKNLYFCGKYDECLKAMDNYNTMSIHDKILQASCWSNLGRHEEAEHQLRGVIENEPGNVYAFYGLGLNFYLSGEFNKCIPAFTQAYAMMPGLMKRAAEYKKRAEKVLNVVGEAVTEFSEGNYNNAVQMLTLAPAIDPDNSSIKTIVNKFTNELMKVLVDSLEAEIFAEDNVELKLKQAEHLIRSNNLEDAAKIIPDVETARCWYVKGLCSYYSGSLKMSVAQFTRALKEDPSLADAHEQSQKATKLIDLIDGASKKMSLKENAAAVELLKSAMEVDPTNKRIVQAIYFQRAMCKLNLGQTHESFEDYLKFEAFQNETGLMMNGIKF